MSSKFKPVEFETPAPEDRIIRLAEPKDPVISQFQFGRVGKKPTYQDIKSKYGALASSDTDKAKKPRKDERFQINEFAKDRLSIDEEERRHMEHEVERRLVELKAQSSQQGYDEGFKQGLEDGKKQSFETLKTQQADNMKALEDLIGSLNGLKQHLYSMNEDYLVKLVYKIGRMVLLKELASDKEYVIRLAKTLVERVGVRDHIRIQIHPQDLEVLSKLREGLEQSFGNLPNLKIETSDQVARGGCKLETDWNAIDASVETQLQSIESTLGQESPA